MLSGAREVGHRGHQHMETKYKNVDAMGVFYVTEGDYFPGLLA